MQLKVVALLVTAITVAACAKSAPETEPAPDIVVQPATNVRVAPGDEPVAPGDCVEAVRRAVAKPDLAVDRIPAPVLAKPAALQRPPRTALRKDGSADVKVDVLIDTLGKADMSTFKVVTTSSKWLADNVKGVIGKWKFEPAQLAGCKVPRVYHFMASAPARKK
ncbi:MAG TPA: hypothetical protein VN706_20550 [Gemmatimonadaceae bacterium]|nr:hypothetical protein [Gemmatimonadaceae bacterium]